MHKTDKDSKKGIKGIEFEFFRDDVSLGKAKTDSNGNVSMPSHIEKTFTSDTFKETYVTNWNDLSERMQQECLNKGWFSSQGQAQTSADKKAQDQLNGLIEVYQNEKHVYKAVETNSGYYYYLRYIPETALLFRSFHHGTPLTYDGLQVYKNQLLVAEYQVPKGFRVIGYVPPYYYAEGKPDIDKEAMVFYRFKLPF